MATTPITVSSPASFPTLHRRPWPSHNFLKPAKFPTPDLALSSRFSPTNHRVRASMPKTEANPPTLAETAISSFQKDASYLWKLAVGSVIGAAVIKYKCIVFPDITRLDLVQALLMIFTPAVASVILLILASREG